MRKQQTGVCRVEIKGNKEISDEKVSDRVNEVKSMEETEAFNGFDKNYNNELFISFKIRR